MLKTQQARLTLFVACIALVGAGFLGGALHEGKAKDDARRLLAPCEGRMETAKQLAYDNGTITMENACRGDIRYIVKSFTPAPNCSLAQVNPDYTIETCEGEALYAQIQTAKEQADAEWNRAAKEGRLLHPVISSPPSARPQSMHSAVA
jgi:hypothetical protein